MQSELKPCAHCGGEAYIDDDTMGHSVVCCKNIECRAQGPFRPTDDEAITAWNARASDAEITRLTEALRAAEERERDAVMSAYCAGATDVHNSWVEGTNGGEADFGEAASDYYSSLAGAKP